MLRAVIIDDEEHCRLGLKTLLQDYCDNVKVVGMADSIITGYELITKENPDLVFLDVIMPEGTGFQLLEKFSTLSFQVIFTTAYREYAIQAIKVSALDYLLKPIKRNELKVAVDKMSERILEDKDKPLGIQAEKRIMIYTERRYLFVNISDVIRIESKGRKALITVKNRENKIEVAKSIAEYEKILSKKGFFKSHRCHLVNIEEVTNYIPDHKGGFIITSDKKPIPLAESRKDDFEKLFIK